MMKNFSILLRIAVVLIGSGVLAGLLWVPPHEGRNAEATLFTTYFTDPFLAYVYIGSIPFFTALYQAFKALGDFGRGEVQPRTVKALRLIRYCALATAGIVAGAVIYIRMSVTGDDDPAGFVIPGILAILISIGAAVGASAIEKKVRNGAGGRS